MHSAQTKCDRPGTPAWLGTCTLGRSFLHRASFQFQQECVIVLRLPIGLSKYSIQRPLSQVNVDFVVHFTNFRLYVRRATPVNGVPPRWKRATKDGCPHATYLTVHPDMGHPGHLDNITHVQLTGGY